LVGPESLSEKDKFVLEIARLVKEAILKQNAYDDVDAFSSPSKQFRMLKLVHAAYEQGIKLIEKGVSSKKIIDSIGDLFSEIIRTRYTIRNNELNKFDELEKKLNEAFKKIGGE